MKNDIMDKIKERYHVKDYVNALKMCEEELAKNPDDDYLWIYKARVLIQLKRNTEAFDVIAYILNRDDITDSIRCFALEQAAKIAYSKADYEEALKCYKKILMFTNKPAVAKNKLARIYAKLKQYNNAINMLDGLKDPQSLITKANILLEINDFYGAKKILESITEDTFKGLSPLKKESFIQEKEYLLGQISLKNSDDALNHYKNAYQGNEHSNIYFKAGYELSKIYYYKHDLNESLKICKRVLNKADEHYMVAQASLLSGSIYMMCGDFKSASDVYKNSHLSFIESYGLAKIANAQYNFEDAMRIINRCDYFDKTLKANVLFERLVIYYRQNRVEDFMKLYEIVKEKKESTPSNLHKAGLMMRSLKLKNGLSVSDPSDYEEYQISNYDVKKAYLHVIDNHLMFDNVPRFNSVDDIVKLFDEVKTLISSKKIAPICDSIYDKYIIEKEGIASHNGEKLDKVAASVVAGTSDIIDICPIEKEGWSIGNENPDIIEIHDMSTLRKKLKK